MLDVTKFRLNTAQRETPWAAPIEKISAKDIAIIGMACRFGRAGNAEEFWECLREGQDLIRPFPSSRRKDTDGYLWMKGRSDREIEYCEGGYLDEIDKFDPLFFKIPPKEASLMDPHQRIFLQTAWHALEDAGYGGKRLSGTNTGVYVGHSSDFGREYKDLVHELERESYALSLGGNVKSIIASRISYTLDFKGPGVVVDTACSSSLAAVHMACRALRGGECDQALAGSVNLRLLPLKSQGVGIHSSIDRARTFDNASDGTGWGEGCAVILLKPLNRALEDGDRVLAVIKGSALNQDGTSNGITAPNPLAQADVIQRAWRDAEIDPETITYFEAHGTGTRLGDPIEIDGITRAFRSYTDSKQFCGIGAVKTNTGHLDNAAGMVGIVKAVLALQHREIPPTIHFQQPNQEIDFLNSPVFIVDRRLPWVTEGMPRRCGISAFGLSGTNCHMVLEEAPTVGKVQQQPIRSAKLLALSATKETVLRQLVDAYADLLQGDLPDLEDLCYTANTGRGHYSHRLILQFETEVELRTAVHLLCNTADLNRHGIPGVFYGQHRLSDEERQLLTGQAREILHRIKVSPSDTAALLRSLIDLYIAGADVDWEAIYRGEKRYRVQLPTYPFEQKRCWVESKETRSDSGDRPFRASNHPLIDGVNEEAGNETVHLTRFTPERQWELKEHIVTGYYVLPGTSYLEMAREASKAVYPDAIELRDLIFLAPLAMRDGQAREAHTILREAEGYHEFSVISKDPEGDDWVTHVDGKICPVPSPVIRRYDLDELKARCTKVVPAVYSNSKTRAIIVGPHWRNVNTYHLGEDELLVHLTLQEQFLAELDHYTIYPSLLDSAVNAASQHIGEGLYLPFSYHSLKLFDRMPANFFSHIRKRADQAAGLETIAFDITLMDETGKAFMEIEDYKIKKVRTQELKVKQSELYYEKKWTPKERNPVHQTPTAKTVLLFAGVPDHSLADQLTVMGTEVIWVTFGTEYAEVSRDQFVISGQAADYLKLFQSLSGRKIDRLIHMGGIGCPDQLDRQLAQGVYSLFHLARALTAAQWKAPLELVLLGEYVYPVTGTEPIIHPHDAASFGLGRVLPAEFLNLRVRTIDLDRETPSEEVIAEIDSVDAPLQVAYRQGRRYVEAFSKVELDDLPAGGCEVREDGVYVITGGTGALGLAVSKHLTAQNARHLALISRTPMPPSHEWDSILAAAADERLCARISALREMEEAGAEVICYAADLADRQRMESVISELRVRYGRVNGVVHCAGVAGDGFILRKEESIFQNVLAPKIHGTRLLDQLTREDHPDFFILFSSINAHYGQPGQGDYTAANAYLDSFAAYREREGFPTLSINWAAWKEIGMAVEYGVNDDRGIFKALSTETGLRAFDELIHKRVTQVTVGMLNYDLLSTLGGDFPFELSVGIKSQLSRRQALQKRREPLREQQSAAQAVRGGSREEGTLEERVTQIWSDVLGVEEVDIYETFYDLGGDSILATYILRELSKQFPGLVDISDIFTYSSVHAMTEFLRTKLNREPAIKAEVSQDLDTALDSMLDQLLSGELDSDGVGKLLMRTLGGDS